MNKKPYQKRHDGTQVRTRSRRRFSLVAVYATALAAFSVYALLDTFVIPRTYASAEVSAQSQGTAADSDAAANTGTLTDSDTVADAGTLAGSDATVATGSASSSRTTAISGDAVSCGTSTTGADAALTDTETDAAASTTSASSATTELTGYRYLDTTIYVVDVYTSDPSQLLTALANDSYGKNITAATSQIAEAHGATVAINGDFYGARNAGYVIRNGVLYRGTAASSDQEDLVIYSDGTMAVVSEGTVSAQQLLDDGAWQVFSFGPGLVVDGSVSVDANDEVGRAMASNPRTAIGQVSAGHYVLVVADGRTSESAGLSLQELATFMKEELGVTCAYNLDGGGSSTLWYQGSVVNNPTSGHGVKERSVSDIVYIAG